MDENSLGLNRSPHKDSLHALCGLLQITEGKNSKYRGFPSNRESKGLTEIWVILNSYLGIFIAPEFSGNEDFYLALFENWANRDLPGSIFSFYRPTIPPVDKKLSLQSSWQCWALSNLCLLPGAKQSPQIIYTMESGVSVRGRGRARLPVTCEGR